MYRIRPTIVALSLLLQVSGCASDAQLDHLTALPATADATSARFLSTKLRDMRSDTALLYVSDTVGSIYVYSYPKLKLQAEVSGLNTYSAGECVDLHGNVFVTTSSTASTGTIYEFSHGGTTPIAALSDPGSPAGCAVNPKNGDLAVTNISDPSNPYSPHRGDLAIYKNAEGQAAMHYSDDTRFIAFLFCGYDSSGDLYLSAENAYDVGTSILLRFSTDSGTFAVIDVGAALDGLSSVQWDGQYMTVTSGESAQKFEPVSIYRLTFSGSTASIVGTTTLRVSKNRFSGQTWINNRKIVGHARGTGDLLVWKYPKGSKPIERLRGAGILLWGVAVSRM